MKIIATALASAALVAFVFALPAMSSRSEQSKSIPARIRALERNVRVLKAQLASTRATANSAQTVAHTAQTGVDNLNSCLGRTLAVSSFSVDGIITAPGGVHGWSNPADGGALVPSTFGGARVSERDLPDPALGYVHLLRRAGRTELFQRLPLSRVAGGTVF